MHCLNYVFFAELNDRSPTELLATHKNSNLIKLEYLEFNLKLGFQSLEKLLPRKIILEKWTAGDKMKLFREIVLFFLFKITRYRVSKNTDKVNADSDAVWSIWRTNSNSVLNERTDVKTHHPDLTWATICVFSSMVVVTEWQLTWDGDM